MLFFLFHFFFVSLQSKHGLRTMQTSWVKISVGYYSKRSETCRLKEHTMIIMGTLTGIVGVFLFSLYRFPASTLNVGRGFVHFLCLYTSKVLAGYFVWWRDALV